MRPPFPRKLWRAIKYLLIGLAILYIGDLAVFQVRLMWGGGMGSVTVDSFLKTPLKGEKLEFDYLGTANQSCSLAHHKTRWQ